MAAEISFYQTSLDPSIDAKNKSASTSFTSEEGISVISEKMQNTNIENNENNNIQKSLEKSLENSLQNNLQTSIQNSIQNINNKEIKTQMMMSASSSEMLNKTSEEISDEKIGGVSSSSFEESSDSEDKKSTTSGASSDLSSDNKTGVQFGTQWMDQTSSSNEESEHDHHHQTASQFNLMVSRSVNRSDSAVSKSSGKSTDSRNSVESRNSIQSRNSLESRISESHGLKTKKSLPLESRKSTDSQSSLFSNSSTAGQKLKISVDNITGVGDREKEQKIITVPNPIKSSDLSEQDLSLYNEYTQVLRQMRRRRESDMKRARRTLEESQWLLDLLWKATNVQKANSRHNSITHELETVQEELEQARLNNIQAFLGKQQKNNSEKTSKNGEKAQKSTEIKRKSSFSKPKNTSQNSNNSPGKKVVVFNRKIAVSQPSVVSSFQVVQNGGAEVPKNLKLKSKIAPRPPSFSTSSLDTKYKVSGGLNPPAKTERTALIGKIIETAVKIDEKEAKLNNTPRRLANNDRLIIKLKIMLSNKWSKDGEMITWTKVDDGGVYDV